MSSRKTKITIENYRRTILKMRRGAGAVRCEICESPTLMVSPNEAAAVLQTTVREIFRLIEAGAIHFSETAGGELLVCRNSLAAFDK